MGVKAQVLAGQPTAEPSRIQPMFRPAAEAGRAGDGDFFFCAAPRVQRQDAPTPAPAADEKKPPDPMLEGLKTTGEQLLKIPAFKNWYEPRLDNLQKIFWESQPSDAKASIITFGGINLALAGLVFALNPEMRQMLSGANVGAPLGLIPYSPVSGFSYTLPEPGKPGYGFSADFTFKPYLDALREKSPGMPLTDLNFGLTSNYDPSGRGFSVTGGKFGMEFFGGGLNIAGKTFNALSPYPQLVPGSLPGGPPTALMQSVPGTPPLHTGPGFAVTVSADLLKLFPGLRGIF